MHYHVKSAEALDSTRLLLTFEDGRRGVYDMAPIIGEGVFAALENPETFAQVRSDGFSVVWPGGLDIAPEELYENCEEAAACA